VEGGDLQADRIARKAGGGSGLSLLRGDQHVQHRGGHRNAADYCEQQPVLPQDGASGRWRPAIFFPVRPRTVKADPPPVVQILWYIIPFLS